MLWLKHLHIALAVLSVSGFTLRAGFRLRTGRRPTGWWGRHLPDLNDTLLLVTGFAMIWRFGWWPWRVPWLGAKLAALVIYIVLGAIALRRGSLAAAVGALAALGYIVAAALTKQPLPGWGA